MIKKLALIIAAIIGMGIVSPPEAQARHRDYGYYRYDEPGYRYSRPYRSYRTYRTYYRPSYRSYYRPYRYRPRLVVSFGAYPSYYSRPYYASHCW